MCHGLAGYFSTNLYSTVDLSIVSDGTFSEGMFSWFPIYFPFKTPVYLLENTNLEISMWRCVNSEKVWYEWCITSPFSTPIQNINGRSYVMKL